MSEALLALTFWSTLSAVSEQGKIRLSLVVKMGFALSFWLWRILEPFLANPVLFA